MNIFLTWPTGSSFLPSLQKGPSWRTFQHSFLTLPPWNSFLPSLQKGPSWRTFLHSLLTQPSLRSSLMNILLTRLSLRNPLPQL